MAEKILLDVPRIGQANSKCCWLACYQMLYKWKGKAASDVNKKLEAAGFSLTSALYQEQWGKAAYHLGLSGMGVGHLGSVENVEWCLAKCGPLWCAGDYLNGSPHAVVVSGIYEDGKMRINDPYEIFKYDSYSYLTHSKWHQLLRKAKFACQLWW
jgi:hypothetical protein